MNDNLSLADQLKSALESATIFHREELRNKRQLTYFARPDAHKWTSALNDYEASLDACEGGNFDLGARLAEKAAAMCGYWAEAYLQAAISHLNAGRHHDCIKMIELMRTNIEGEALDAHRYAASAFADLGEANRSLSEAMAEIRVFGVDSELLYDLAGTFNILGQRAYEPLDAREQGNDLARAYRACPFYECSILCFARAWRLDPAGEVENEEAFFQMCGFIEFFRSGMGKPGRVKELIGVKLSQKQLLTMHMQQVCPNVPLDRVL